MPGIKPNKKELAEMKVLKDMGVTPTTIAKQMGRSHHTVIKYLNSDVYNDPSIREIIERLKEKEIVDLYLLGAKARNRLHTLLDEDDTKAIETTAIMDRSFQQRRLLEGKSTANIAYQDVSRELEEIEAEIALLEGTATDTASDVEETQEINQPPVAVTEEQGGNTNGMG